MTVDIYFEGDKIGGYEAEREGDTIQAKLPPYLMGKMIAFRYERVGVYYGRGTVTKSGINIEQVTWIK